MLKEILERRPRNRKHERAITNEVRRGKVKEKKKQKRADPSPEWVMKTKKKKKMIEKHFKMMQTGIKKRKDKDCILKGKWRDYRKWRYGSMYGTFLERERRGETESDREQIQLDCIRSSGWLLLTRGREEEDRIFHSLRNNRYIKVN